MNNKLINEYVEKYKIYSNYLSETFFQKAIEQFYNNYSFNDDINPSISLGFYMQNVINKELVNYIKNGDIDLEISLIEKYMPILNHIINKMHLHNKIKDKEAILISAIETYDGKKLLSIHILNIVKDYLKRNNQIINSNNLENNEIEISFEKIVENYISKKNISKIELNYLDSLIVKFDLISIIQDDCLKKYIYLKYGYYNGILFSDEDIRSILNLTKEDIKVLYISSLNLLKKVLNKNISLLLTYDLEDVKQEKFYIKN